MTTTKQKVIQAATVENAKQYFATTDKFVFCLDLLELSLSDGDLRCTRIVEQLEDLFEDIQLKIPVDETLLDGLEKTTENEFKTWFDQKDLGRLEDVREYVEAHARENGVDCDDELGVAKLTVEEYIDGGTLYDDTWNYYRGAK